MCSSACDTAVCAVRPVTLRYVHAVRSGSRSRTCCSRSRSCCSRTCCSRLDNLGLNVAGWGCVNMQHFALSSMRYVQSDHRHENGEENPVFFKLPFPSNSESGSFGPPRRGPLIPTCVRLDSSWALLSGLALSSES